jgi:putative transposase
MSSKIYYRRRLPHIQPAEGTFSIIYRLHGSLPKSIIKKLREEYERKKIEIFDKHKEKVAIKKALNILSEEYFEKVERYADQALYGPNLAKRLSSYIYHYGFSKIYRGAFRVLDNLVILCNV